MVAAAPVCEHMVGIPWREGERTLGTDVTRSDSKTNRHGAWEDYLEMQIVDMQTNPSSSN